VGLWVLGCSADTISGLAPRPGCCTRCEPHDYAEAILNVCKLYVESPLACVSGVSGSDLKKRIQAILAGRIAGKLTFAKKAVLAAAGILAIAAPIALGVMNAPAIRAQSAPAVKFEVASIKPCRSDAPGRKDGNGAGLSPGTLKVSCQTVGRLIEEAYDFLATGKPRFRGSPVSIEGAPSWINTERYTIEAKSESPQGRGMMHGPMMQALLEDRFKLKLRRVPREVPVYLLTVAKGGTKFLEPAKKGACVPWDFDNLPRTAPGQHDAVPCGMIGRRRRSTNGTAEVELYGSTMPNLAEQFSMLLGRPVIDQTGLSGTFDFHVEVPVDELAAGASDPAAPGPPADESALAFAAVRKLGLKLQSAKGPGEIFVIDHIERPSEN
jgi:bla regulator protein BlaR1